MQFKCGKCESAEWKLASFIYNNGTGDIDISTTGESQVRKGLGVERTQTTSESTGAVKSRLAQQAAPPVREPDPGEFKTYAEFNKYDKFKYLLCGFGIISSVFDSKTTWGTTFMNIVILVVIMLYVSYRGSNEVYQIEKAKHDLAVNRYERTLEAYKVWELTKVCMRCGTLDKGLTTTET